MVFQKRRKFIILCSTTENSFDVINKFYMKFQELFPSNKYKFKNEEDCYQLIIYGPKVEDTGKYTIDISGVSSTAFLNVDGKLIKIFTKQSFFKKNYTFYLTNESIFIIFQNLILLIPLSNHLTSKQVVLIGMKFNQNVHSVQAWHKWLGTKEKLNQRYNIQIFFFFF